MNKAEQICREVADKFREFAMAKRAAEECAERIMAECIVPEEVSSEPVAWISEEGLNMLKDSRGQPRVRVAHTQYAIYTVPLYRRRPQVER